MCVMVRSAHHFFLLFSDCIHSRIIRQSIRIVKIYFCVFLIFYGTVLTQVMQWVFRVQHYGPECSTNRIWDFLFKGLVCVRLYV